MKYKVLKDIILKVNNIFILKKVKKLITLSLLKYE